MNTDNIYQHPTVSWDRARQAFEQIQRKEGELIDAWLELGRQLNVLREKHPSDQDFGAACQAHDIDLTHKHRSAAMWLASLDADQLDSLRQYNPTAIHPKTLQDRCREQFPDWLTSTRAGLPSGQTADSTLSSQPETAETGVEAGESTESADQNNASKAMPVTMPRLDSRNALWRVLRNNEQAVKAIYTQWTCKTTQAAFSKLAAKAGSKKVLLRIANMIPTHCRGQNDSDYQHKFSHRVFVPEINIAWARRYGCEWTNPKAINAILDEIDDAWRMVDAIGEGRPLQDYVDWWESRGQRTPVIAGPDLSAFSKPPEDKPRIRASGEGSIRAYGVEIWPAVNPSYTFDEAWAAYQFWKTEDQALSSATGFEKPDSRGRHFMSQCDYLNRLNRGFVTAWRKITTAQFQHPDAHDDCCCPHQHINIS